jgi:2'-5' RNA ligase
MVADRPRAKTLRLFLAIELPEPWRVALVHQSRRLEAQAPGFGRWVDPSLLHLTLVFLGNQPVSALQTIDSASAAAAGAHQPFNLALEGLGRFGSSRAVRVVWVGIADAPAGTLAGLRKGLVDSLSGASVEFDSAPFSPHITLARAQRDATPAQSDAIQRALQSTPGFGTDLEPLNVQEIVLIQSDLRPTGPIYTPLQRFSFGS